MRSNFLSLLSSTAFTNAGAAAMAEYKQSPDAKPLVQAAMNAPGTGEDVAEGLEAYAKDIGCMVDYWDQTDAIVEGYDAVRNAADKYLPKFNEEKTDDYKVRLQLTKFTNIYRDIVEGLASKPFEEEITLLEDDKAKPPEEIKTFIEDVDGGGNSITQFGSLTFFNGINSAIDWIFVDFPSVDRTRIVTRADEKKAGIRPFWSHVLGRNVREVRTAIVNGKRELSYIRVFEPGVSELDRVRIMLRDETGGVFWFLYEKIESQTDQKQKYALIQQGKLTIDVIPYVPFTTGRRDGASWKFFPAMRDAADLQIKLYQNESGLEFISNMAGYPMLAANGMRPELEADGKTPKKVAIGPMRLLYGLPNDDGSIGNWQFIEPAATSMEFLQKKNDKTKEDLRELGRQPLTAQSGNLTVITTAVAAGKARSAVSAWALELKNALENALVITAKWLNLSGYEPEVNVFNEFDSFTDGNSDLDALDKARARGDISNETFLSELKRRKVLAPEFDFDKEQERLLKEVPSEPDEDAEDDNADPVKQPGKAA